MVTWIAGFWALARLALRTRLRFRGEYWRWRLHTAFGRGLPDSRGELVRGVLRYVRWMGQMRRL